MTKWRYRKFTLSLSFLIGRLITFHLVDAQDVFQLIVPSFENFHDECSRSYSKRALVLETVAKVRSCVIVLDLECDKLITEMFQHFLKEIRYLHISYCFKRNFAIKDILTLSMYLCSSICNLLFPHKKVILFDWKFWL